MKYTNIKFLTGILLLVFLPALAVAQTQDDPLNLADAGAMQDIRETMGDDIFSPGQQDQRGNATPVITGKGLPGSIAGSQPSLSQARLLSPTSTWSLSLLDSQERSVVLQMYQSNDVMFGRGTIAVGSIIQNASATGTISGNKLDLDVLSDDLTLFRLSLTMNGKSLSGDYHGYSVRIVPWKGIAMGKIN